MIHCTLAFKANQCNVLTHHVLWSPILLFSISSLCYCSSAALPLSSLLSCNRKFSQLPAKASLRFQEAARTSLAETECSVPGGVCQSWANKGCKSPIQRRYIHSKQEVKNPNKAITEAVSLKLAARDEYLTGNCCQSEWFQSTACNSPKGKRTVFMTSKFEWVIVKDLKSGSRRVKRQTQSRLCSAGLTCKLGQSGCCCYFMPLTNV